MFSCFLFLKVFLINLGFVLFLQYPIAFGGGDTIEKDKYEKLQEVLGWAKDFIAETGYVAGSEKLTLADLCFVSTLSSISASG